MGFIQKRLAVLDAMDPHRIYVENVRAFLGVRTPLAAWLCRKACRDGFLERWTAYEHPDLGHTMFECRQNEAPDESMVVTDTTAEALGHEAAYQLKQLKKVEFFRRGF